MTAKGLGIAAGAVAAAALIVGPALLSDSPSAVIVDGEERPYRFAVADVACLQAEGITGADVRRVCADFEVRGGYLGCVTDREAIHKCEVAREDLPPAAFKKLMGCRCDFGEGQQDIVRLVPLSWVKPAECNCLTICPNVINSKSRANVWSELEICLEGACTGCDVTPTDWGPCPHCLAPGRDCATECAAE